MAEHTGMRVGELVALHKSDVYPDKGYIHVHRQQHPLYDSEGHLHFEELPFTKDEKKHPHGGRKVPILPECQRVIDLAMELKGESEYLFHDAKGKWVSEDSYLANLRKRCRRVAREVLKDESLTEEEKQELADIPTNNHAFRIAFKIPGFCHGFEPRFQIQGLLSAGFHNLTLPKTAVYLILG